MRRGDEMLRNHLQDLKSSVAQKSGIQNRLGFISVWCLARLHSDRLTF